MRSFIFVTFASASLARMYHGECADMTRNFFKELGKEDFDPAKIQGTWFEIFRDKMTYWELTGKCANTEAKMFKAQTTTPVTIASVKTTESTVSDAGVDAKVDLQKKIDPKDGYVQVLSLKTQSEDFLFKKTYVYEGGWFCKEDAEKGTFPCYVDYGSYHGGFGQPPRIDGTILATDYDNWAVSYACHQRPFNMKSEYLWISWKQPSMDEAKLPEVEEAIRKLLPDFDLGRLKRVAQGEEHCKYEL